MKNKALRKYFIFYGIASLLIFPALIIGPKASAIVLILWLFATGLLCKHTLFARYTPADLVNHGLDKSAEKWKEKKYAESMVRYIAIPMSGVGLVMIVIILIVLFTM